MKVPGAIQLMGNEVLLFKDKLQELPVTGPFAVVALFADEQPKAMAAMVNKVIYFNFIMNRVKGNCLSKNI